MSNKSSIFNHLKLLMLITLILTTSVNASSVREVTIEEASLNTAFIFEGRVISKEVRPSPQDDRPYTYFTFEIIEVIKGTHPAKQIEIGFAGGTIDGMTLSVTGLRMPELNESGVYFVESLTQELVHPLYGWSQGHYLISSAKKVLRVQQSSPGLVASPQALLTALSLSEFKQQIRNILGTTAP